MTQDEFDYRGPEGNLNSTAQLLRHLTVVHLYWVWRLQGHCLAKKWARA